MSHEILNRAVRLAATVAAAAMVLGTAFAEEQEQEKSGEEIEEVVVQSTRSGKRVQDEAIRVEVISGEEVDEKVMMMPGNIAMMVAETGGVRVQVTSPSLGASNVRMQGMTGRYTQILADGLPLYGGQTSSLGLMQIPPTDLGQVEVIKGAASALYGSSALGGIINLISRRPSREPTAEVLANVTSRDAQDITTYASGPLNDSWSGSLTGGLHRQSKQDLDRDGWIDMPGYERATLRPRLYWNGEGGANALLTLGAMSENRTGGTLPGRTTPDGQPFPLAQNTRRLDAGAVVGLPMDELGTLQIRASGVTQDLDRRYGTSLQTDKRDTEFIEASLAAKRDRTSLLGGVALQRDRYSSREFSVFDYTFTVPGAFAQIEQDFADDLTLAASARWDHHSEYGARLSPRLSLLYRPAPWTLRASVGKGFYAPTPFVEETEAAGLSRLAPLSGIRAESAKTASLDIGRVLGRIETNLVLFTSEIDGAVRLDEGLPQPSVYGVRLVNAPSPTRTKGSELLVRYRWDAFTVTGSYVYVDASESDLRAGRTPVPLTPRHTAGIVGIWERPGVGRVGAEVYYTGEQVLEDNPYRDRSPAYFEVGFLGELSVGRASLFVNLENLLDVRQTKHDPLLLPRRAANGRWEVDAWQSTEGFVANAGVRLRWGER